MESVTGAYGRPWSAPSVRLELPYSKEKKAIVLNKVWNTRDFLGCASPILPLPLASNQINRNGKGMQHSILDIGVALELYHIGRDVIAPGVLTYKDSCPYLYALWLQGPVGGLASTGFPHHRKQEDGSHLRSQLSFELSFPLTPLLLTWKLWSVKRKRIYTGILS